MTDKIISPAFLVRAYAWEVLKLNDPTTWDTAKYGGLTPIVPLSEEPELSQYSGPHIVYGYTVNSNGVFYQENTGTVSFAIYDSNFRRLTKTMNILQHAFERHDETARDINRYTDSIRNKITGVRFGSVSVGYVEGGTPEDSEGGDQSAIITINYSYFVDYDVITNVVP